MSETVIHRRGKDVTPIRVYGTVDEVQATLDSAHENDVGWASFSTTNGSSAHISPDTVDHLEGGGLRSSGS
jgi:hypothetical protein